MHTRWTAFGIMLGFMVSVAFQHVRPITGNENEPWRWMMASTAIPPMIVMAQVYCMSLGWNTHRAHTNARQSAPNLLVGT